MMDVLIPLVAGLTILVKPELFLKKDAPPEAAGKKKALFKKIGWALIGVSALYFILKRVR